MSEEEEEKREQERGKKTPLIRVLEEFKERREELPPEILEMMERMDEDQIVEELKGLKPETMIYQFPIAGREAIGLSYAGVREAARRMGYLELFDLKVEEKDEAWYASVRGRDNIRCLTLYGVSYQSKKMRLKDGTITDDPYAYVKAANKACRNALRALLPEKVVNETIEYFLELGAKPVRPPAPERPPAPPKPEPVEMEVPSEERKLAEGIWMPIKASDGREYGTLKVIEPGVLRVEFDQPLPLDPALEAGPGGWMKRQLDAIRDKDGREGYRFEWKPEWVGEFLASLTLEMERPLDEKRLKHLETVFSWPAMRSLQRV